MLECLFSGWQKLQLFPELWEPWELFGIPLSPFSFPDHMGVSSHVLIRTHLGVQETLWDFPSSISVQLPSLLTLFSCSVTQLCLTLCAPWTTARQAFLSFPISRSLLKFMSIDRVGDAIQSSHPLSSTSPPAFNLSQHQGLFQ